MNTLPDLLPGRLLVLLGPHAAAGAMLAIAARLSLHGPVRVLDGGNRFNAYTVARAVRSQAGEGFSRALARISVARAFTCYQMLTLLEQAQPDLAPKLVIDFLDTFYDQSVKLPERQRLLERCVKHLRRLSRQAVVVVSLRPPRPPQTDPTGMQQSVQAAADLVWVQEEVTPEPPPRLL